MQLVDQYEESNKDVESCFNIAIDMGNSIKDHIIVHKQDIPKELAATFCTKHGLGKEQEEKLAAKISECVDELLFDKYMKNAEEESDESNSLVVGDEGIESSRDNFLKLGNTRRVKQLSQITNRRKIQYTARMPSMKSLDKAYLNNCTSSNKLSKDVSIYHKKQNSMSELNKTIANTSKQQQCRVKASMNVQNNKVLGRVSFLTLRNSKNKGYITYSSKELAKSYCENLYQTGLLKKRRQERLAQENRELRAKEELKQATFHPKIRSKHYKGSKSFQDRLSVYENLSKMKRRNERLSHLAQENKNCTFRPLINKL